MSHGLLAGKGPASTGMHSIGEARGAAVKGRRGRDRSARGRNEGRSGGSGEGLLLGPGLPVGTRRTLWGQTATQAAHAVTTLNGTAGRLTPCVFHILLQLLSEGRAGTACSAGRSRGGPGEGRRDAVTSHKWMRICTVSIKIPIKERSRQPKISYSYSKLHKNEKMQLTKQSK